MNKYIKCSDLLECIKEHRKWHGNDYTAISEFDIIKFIKSEGMEMVSVSDVKCILDYIGISTNPEPKLTNTAIRLRELVGHQKYSGLTSNGWEQLSKLAFVTIEIYSNMGDKNIVFLDDFMDQCGELEEIRCLCSDPENMERTNTDIPAGIKVEYTWKNENKTVVVSRASTVTRNGWIYYRILGVDE